jgi:ParB family chromosome partitioning protein
MKTTEKAQPPDAVPAGQRVRVADIKIRHTVRKDLGDLAALARSIVGIGLIQAVVVTADMTLVAGRRRLEAVRMLNWETIPAYISNDYTDAVRMLQAQLAENSHREPLRPSEMAAAATLLREGLEKEARQRQAAAGPATGKGKKRSRTGSENLSEAVAPQADKGRVRDQVAAALGVSGVTLEHAEFVVARAAKAPAKYASLVRQMDATGRVDPAYRAARELAALGDLPPAEAHQVVAINGLARDADRLLRRGGRMVENLQQAARPEDVLGEQEAAAAARLADVFEDLHRTFGEVAGRLRALPEGTGR